MSSRLISECPGCRTRFRVTEEQLAAAGGRVRCGACLAVFNGRDNIVAQSTPSKEDDPIDVLLDSGEPDDTKAAPSTGTLAKATDSPTTSRQVPDERKTQAHPTHRGGRRVGVYGFAVVAALALLAVGVLVVQFDVYSQQPAMRDIYESVGVELPQYKALTAIRVVESTVRERTGTGAPLVIDVDLINTAPLYQRFPAIDVRFRAADGESVAEERVESSVYLPSPTHSRRMTPNKTVPISLRLDDPGSEAVSYAISLL